MVRHTFLSTSLCGSELHQYSPAEGVKLAGFRTSLAYRHLLLACRGEALWSSDPLPAELGVAPSAVLPDTL